MSRRNNHTKNWIRIEKRLAIYIRDRFICGYCAIRCNYDNITLDHVIARDKGGSNEPDNLIVSCLSCNSSKQNTAVQDWLQNDRLLAVELRLQKPIDSKIKQELSKMPTNKARQFALQFVL